jgi:hypothetical protein
MKSASRRGEPQHLADPFGPEMAAVFIEKALVTSAGGRCCRLGERPARKFQDLVASTQLIELALQIHVAMRFGRGHAFAHPAVDFLMLDRGSARARAP